MTLLLIAVVLLLQVADAWSTWHVLRFQRGVEANPVTAFLMDTFGPAGGLFVAKVWAGAVVLVAHYHGAWAGTLPMVALFALVVFYAAVVVNNLKILYAR